MFSLLLVLDVRYRSRGLWQGTPHFMAAEAIAFKYLFSLKMPTTPKSDFTHFALHDIESLWWTGIWMIVFHLPPDHVETSDQKNARRQKTAKLFPGTKNDYEVRHDFFKDGLTYRQSLADWLSSDFDSFSSMLDQNRKRIDQTSS